MMVFALTITAIATAAVAGGLVLPRLMDSVGMRKKNFRGESIPAAYGALIAFYAILGCILLRLFNAPTPRVIALYAAVIGGMAVLGILDDLYGSRDTGGFRGHFKKLLFERKLTTGAVKAMGGGVLALGLSAVISGNSLECLMNAMLIALSANALNLVDLRPGRALGAFAAGLTVILIACGFTLSGVWPLAVLMVPTAALAWQDTRGRAMMGDTGSNALGGALGMTLVLDGQPAVKLAAIAFLIGMHVLCEKHSLSQIIERHAILKKIDSLLGVR